MRPLLVLQRASENARQAQNSPTAASQTIRRRVLADQLTFNTEHGGLQFDETDLLACQLLCHFC